MSIWSRIVGKKRAEPLTLVLYTRAQCPLCDEMKAEIARARLGGRCALIVVDIDVDPVLVERHGRSVPVLEIEGRAAFKGRLSAEDLEREVARALRERA
ncbi:MAG: glutaredoxin family protein [Planctomycetota bacterium]